MESSIVPVSSPLSSEFYKTDNPNLGIALIFCNIDEKDIGLSAAINGNKIRLKNILDQFGFDVRIFDNFDYGKITDTLDNVSKEDHSQNDCLLTIFISVERSIVNSEHLYGPDDLFRCFSKDSCTLKNKPKLNFIDICRGEKRDLGTHYQPDAQLSFQEPKEYFIPKTADLFIHFSTYKDSMNFQNTTTGSWFIESLSTMFEKYFGEIKDKKREYIDIYELATAVNRRVAYCYQSEPNQVESNELKMMPIYTSSLTKLFRVMVKQKTK